MLNSYVSGKYTIDRFETELAVLLFRPDESIELIVPRAKLPDGTEKGSILEIDIENGNLKSITFLKNETEAIRKRNKEWLQELLNR